MVVVLQPRPLGIVSRAAARHAEKIRRQGQEFDHENRKTPISKPAANAQRPNVQAETTRTRLRRSCGISWDSSVIAAAPCGGRQPVTGELAILVNTDTLLLIGAEKKAIVPRWERPSLEWLRTAPIHGA